MDELVFSNSNIDLACEDVGVFLSSVGVEKREALRIKLTLEELLLDYQEKFGEDAKFQVRCVKRLMAIKVELTVKGRVFNPLEKNEEENVIHSILAGIGLSPSYGYKNGKNCVVFTPKKKPISGTVKMGVAIALAVLFGILLSLMPEWIRDSANDYLLTPVTDAFMGLIAAVSIPLIFLSILSSICSMGNMETLGRIGSRTLRALLLTMTVVSILMMLFGSLFYRVEAGDSGDAGFSQIISLIYDIIPSNLFEPFITGNTLQLIFVAVTVGLAMLVLSSKVHGVFGLIDELNAIIQLIMSGLSSLLPVLIFVLFSGMISGGELGTLINSWKMIAVIALMVAVFFTLNVLRVAAAKKVSPLTLLKKIRPTFMIALTTASSVATFSTNLRDTNKKLGVSKTLTEFGVPLGQVLFDPAGLAVLTGIELTMAELYGVPITPSFLVIAMITNLLISIASPPVPGGCMMCYAVAFAQLGIPIEAIGVVLLADMILDFPVTACNVSSWQLTLVNVADSLDMLDVETLRKQN